MAIHAPNARTAAAFKGENDISNSEHYQNDAVDETDVEVRAGAVVLTGYELHNTTGSDAFLQLFDALAANVTVGTTAPDYVITLAANAARGRSFTKPLEFKNGLTIAGTTAWAGNTGAAIDVSLDFA